MITANKLRDFVKQFRAKTDAKKMEWLPDSMDDSGCMLLLPHSKVRIVLERPDPEHLPDRVVLTIENGDGTVVGELTATSEDSDWELLHGLYEAASKAAYGWDLVLADLERAVSEDGSIGGGRQSTAKAN
ncbi:MAG TPA: hypothetical protein VKT80_07095 [Chloroflexota bacterium]|nr:hypothetical protein [Chloroflexota bacterium]